jgi:hypothetical protein
MHAADAGDSRLSQGVSTVFSVDGGGAAGGVRLEFRAGARCRLADAVRRLSQASQVKKQSQVAG